MKKTRVISAFKSAEAPIRVLLLSLTTAASGTNLIEATHIIFLGNINIEKERKSDELIVLN